LIVNRWCGSTTNKPPALTASAWKPPIVARKERATRLRSISARGAAVEGGLRLRQSALLAEENQRRQGNAQDRRPH
jgi:hypothetical protein